MVWIFQILILILSFEITLGIQNNVSCLFLDLHDTFGDGWGDVGLLIETPNGNVLSLAPDCSRNPLTTRRCFKEDGIYFVTSTSTTHNKPKNSWEIYWTVSTLGKFETTYIGGFNTTLAFHYTTNWGWRLIYWDNLWTGAPRAQACGLASPDGQLTSKCHGADIPSTQLISKLNDHIQGKFNPTGPGPIKQTVIGKGGRLGKEKLLHSTEMFLTTRSLGESKLNHNDYIKKNQLTTTNGNHGDNVILSDEDFYNHVIQIHSERKSVSKSIMENSLVEGGITRVLDSNEAERGRTRGKHEFETLQNKIHAKKMARPEATLLSALKVEMHDPSGNGWKTAALQGVSFQISDDTKTTLLAYGSLDTGLFEGICSYCFKEGSYYFRLTDDSNMTTDARWTFCNTNGKPSQELSFHIEDGICYPDVLNDVNALCHREQYSLITVVGDVAIDGISTETFGADEAEVLSEALAQAVYGWASETIDVRVASLNPYLSTTELDYPEAATSAAKNRRGLAAFSYDLSFRSTFVTELVYEIDGTNYNSISDLVDVLQSELISAINSGEVLTSLQSIAQSSDIASFKDITRVIYRSFAVEEVAHVGSSRMDIIIPNDDLDSSDVDTLDESDLGLTSEVRPAAQIRYERVQESSSFELSIMFCVGAIALLGLLVKIKFTKVEDVVKVNVKSKPTVRRRERMDIEIGNKVQEEVAEKFETLLVMPSEKEARPHNFLRRELLQDTRRTVVL